MLALTFINKCLICNLCKYRGCHILLLHFASMKAITKELKDTHCILVLCFKSIVFFHVDMVERMGWGFDKGSTKGGGWSKTVHMDYECPPF